MPAPKERSSSSRDKPEDNDNEDSSSEEESSAEEVEDAPAEETTRGLKPKAKAGPLPVPEERAASVVPVPGHTRPAEPKEPPKQVLLVPDEDPGARRNRSRERRGRSRRPGTRCTGEQTLRMAPKSRTCRQRC